MDTDDIKKITRKPNTNTEDKIDNIPVDDETHAKNMIIKHHMYLRQHQDLLTKNTGNIRETLKGTIPATSSLVKNSTLPDTGSYNKDKV